MPGFEKAQAGSMALFSAASAGLVGEARLMFGCPCRFVKGNMVAGTYADRVFFRVARTDQAALMASDPRLRPFEPVAGRPMRDYLEVKADALGEADLRRFLVAAFALGESLPAKEKETRAKGGRNA